MGEKGRALSYTGQQRIETVWKPAKKGEAKNEDRSLGGVGKNAEERGREMQLWGDNGKEKQIGS
jgi:hypothetical protein